MKQSRRARRLQRHYRRMHRAGGLNLVSLMDIFTILVFFLMVNSSDVKVLEQSSQVELPQSTAERRLTDVLTLELAGDAILIQGRTVATLGATSADGRTIPELAQELQVQFSRRAGENVPPEGLPITIMGDRTLPYAALKTVMRTSVNAGFRQVRLAVEHKPEESPRG